MTMTKKHHRLLVTDFASLGLELRDLLPQVREIFFLVSSRKKFSTEAEKEEFFLRWTAFYLENCLDEFWVAIDSKSNRLLGYLMGCRQSQSAIDYFKKELPSQLTFQERFDEYPAHFHINCHPKMHGQGIGSILIHQYIDHLAKMKISGVHIITSKGAPNINFYKKNGLEECQEKQWKGHNLIFLGKKLGHPVE